MSDVKNFKRDADISNEVRPSKISQPMIESLYEENFAQGKLEKQLSLEVTPIMDEDNVSFHPLLWKLELTSGFLFVAFWV